MSDLSPGKCGGNWVSPKGGDSIHSWLLSSMLGKHTPGDTIRIGGPNVGHFGEDNPESHVSICFHSSLYFLFIAICSGLCGYSYPRVVHYLY